MNKCIVTTTIHAPTKALERFAALPEWQLIVVGDLATPRDWSLEKAIYLSPDDQEAMDAELSSRIGWNCIQRRNFGFILAARMGAKVVATVDDDNIPYAGWGSDPMVGREIEADYYEVDGPVFDPVGATEYAHLWHRGFPLQHLGQRNYSRRRRTRITPDVEAGFWNGDPDIDAVCRMEHHPSVNFEPSKFPMASNAMAPFNSQNTMISARFLGDYFLFPRIGRMDDIWAAFWLQAKGAKVVFSQASVYQDRNIHDLTRDLEAEIRGHLHSCKLIEALGIDGPDAIWSFLPEGSKEMYLRYRIHF